jgi:hypothetical protein
MYVATVILFLIPWSILRVAWRRVPIAGARIRRRRMCYDTSICISFLVYDD